MKCDYHVHTCYSDDSDYQMEEVIRDAIALKLDEICLTDHVDYGIKVDWDCPDTKVLHNVNYPAYVQQIRYLQQKYAGQIKIKLGLEFGVQQHTITEYERLFECYPFDFIILSVHQIDNQELWTQDFQKGKTRLEAYRRYYEEVLYLVQHFHQYSVLGHLDLISRYDHEGPLPFAQVQDLVQKILQIVIQDGKGIEINTSSHRYGLTDLTPSRDILSLYQALGGTILTIGSDTHKKGQLGAHFFETEQELKKIGFKKYCTFTQMKPEFHDLAY